MLMLVLMLMLVVGGLFGVDVARQCWFQTEIHTRGRHLATRPLPCSRGSELTQSEGVEIISERVESVLEDSQSAVEILRRFLGKSIAEIICLHAISVGLQ